MLTKLASLTMLALFANCTGDTERSDQSISMTEHLESFEVAREELGMSSTSHVSVVMGKEAMRDLTRLELNWADSCSSYIHQMRTSLLLLGKCRNTAGELLDVSESLAATADLELELRAHEIGMLSCYDLTTAHAVEQNFHIRQETLIEELEAHFQAFDAVADQYSCAF